MADEKAKIVTDATGPSSGPAPAQPEVDAQVFKQEQSAPEAPTPDKAEAPAQEAPAQDKAVDAPKEQKAASVSVFNFSEIMAEKKATERAAAQQEAKAPDKGTSPTPTKEDGPKQEKSKEQEQAPKRRGRPPKADKYKAAAPAQKEAPSKKDKAVQKSAQPGKTEKAAPSEKTEKAPKAPSPAKGAPEVKAPVQDETPAAPAEAPRPGKEEQIVYIKLSELHAFKNHPFQVRNDEEMKAMVSSVRDKGVTQPAIVRPREDGGYEIVSGHRRQKASELAGFVDMPCIVRDLTDEQAITQMVEDNTNQRENILPSERAKALKMQLEAIKHQGAKEATSGQLDPKDAGRRSNEIVAERNKMTVKQVAGGVAAVAGDLDVALLAHSRERAAGFLAPELDLDDVGLQVVQYQVAVDDRLQLFKQRVALLGIVGADLALFLVAVDGYRSLTQDVALLLHVGGELRAVLLEVGTQADVAGRLGVEGGVQVVRHIFAFDFHASNSLV